MRITILTSSDEHPVYSCLKAWSDEQSGLHEVVLTTQMCQVRGGDFLFLISCSEIVSQEVRALYRHSLVVHASDLPKGRGWSPYVWQILEGSKKIVVTLLEAEDKVDSGAIWLQENIELEGHELSDEIQALLALTTVRLMEKAVAQASDIEPKPQSEESATYYPKRSPEDSRLDIESPLVDQINLLRVCDPDRYPAFFDYKGHRYKIVLEKLNENSD